MWATAVLIVVNVIFWFGWINGYPPAGVDAVTLGTLVTAAATLLLAYFAWKAWRAALSTMEAQSNSDQISALAEYVKAFNSLSRVSPFSYPRYSQNQYVLRDHLEAIDSYNARLLELTQQVESAATIWRAHHKTVGGEMAAFAEAESFLIESMDWWRGAGEDCPDFIKNEQHQLWTQFAKDLSRLATHWQVNEPERQKNADTVMFKLDRYLFESPLLPHSLKDYEAVSKKDDTKKKS